MPSTSTGNQPYVTRKNKHLQNYVALKEKNTHWSGLVFPDKFLMVSISLLLIIGIVMVTTASIPKAGSNGGWIYYYSARQLAYITVGLTAAAIAFHIPTERLFKNADKIMLLGIVLLIIVQIPGVSPSINGARRWIPLGFANLQPSEFTRICTIIYAGYFLKKHQNNIHKSFTSMFKLMAILGVVAALLLAQPDYGSTAVIFAIVLGMTFLAGVHLIRFAAALSIVVVLGILGIVSSAYRMKRLVGYLDPWEDMFGKGYQLVNSLIAIGRGEITGVGIGESLEKHHYLPEAHTDFIFSILAEETGLVGVLILISLFAIIVWRAFVIARNADSVYRRASSCVAYGIGLWIGMQSLINMSVASGLLPTKGLTLPLISYGGSSVGKSKPITIRGIQDERNVSSNKYARCARHIKK